MRHGRPYPPPHMLPTHTERRGASSPFGPTAATSALVLPPPRDSDLPRPSEAQPQQPQRQQEGRGSLKRHVTQQDLLTLCPPVAKDIAVPSTCAGALHALKESRLAVRYECPCCCVPQTSKV